MANIHKIKIIAQYTLLETIREKTVLVFILVAFGIMLTNVVFAELFSWSLGKISIEFGLSISALIGLLLIFFLVIRLLYKDLENQTIYFLYSRPINNADYIIGKYIGFALLILLSVCLLGIGTAISVKYITIRYSVFVSVNFTWWIFLLSFLFQILSLFIVLAVSFFWFSFMTESFPALLLTLLTYIIGSNMDLIRKLFIDTFIESSGDIFFYYLALTVTYLLPDLSLFNLKSNAAYGIQIEPSTLIVSCIYGFAYIAIVLIASIFFFSKRKSL